MRPGRGATGTRPPTRRTRRPAGGPPRSAGSRLPGDGSGRTAGQRAGEAGGDPPGPRPGGCSWPVSRPDGTREGWMGRTGRPMRGPAALELAHREGGQQRARGAEEDPGEGIGQPVRPEIGAGQRHQDREDRRRRAPHHPRPAGRYQRDDRGDHGHGGGDRVPGGKRGTARDHQRSGRPGPVVDHLQRADQDLGQNDGGDEGGQVPPPAAQREETGDGDPDRKRDVDQPEPVEDLGGGRDRRRTAGDHEPQTRVVGPLQVSQQAVVGDRGERRGGERQYRHGDDRVPAAGGQHLIFRYPGHDAPRPHSARPSWSRTYFTSLARGMKPTPLSTAVARIWDAPAAKSNRYMAQPPGKVYMRSPVNRVPPAGGRSNRCVPGRSEGSGWLPATSQAADRVTVTARGPA